LLSLLYPPFRIVDFMFSRVLHSTIGFGIFNFADVCYLAGYVAAAVALAAQIVTWTRRFIERSAGP
jgi:lipoprotein signal peptidase